MAKKILLLGFAFCLVAYLSGAGIAEELTLQLVKAKVEAAAKLLATEGETAFPKLKDPTGEFRFADGKGYIWVHDMSGKMLMHPTQPALEGTNMLGSKDSAGFPFIFAMNELVRKNGSGWVVYMWPKPGKKVEELKGSYVKLVNFNERGYVVGCGMYDVSKDYIKSLYPSDVVYDSSNFNATP